MTAPTFEDYVEPVHEDSDTYKPKENYDKPLLVKVREHKTGVVTEFSPEGGEAVIVDLVDLADGNLYKNVLWMGGAVVDGLKANAASPNPLVIRFEKRKSNSGRNYPAPAKASDEDKALAQSYYSKKGDPFLPTLGDPTAEKTGDDQSPPW
jgi:hypothetical protein